MRKYRELPFNKKLNLLREHEISGDWPDLDFEKWCLHCREKFSGHSVRVWQDAQGRLWLECGTPECDGSPIDWADYPWWDDHHPATKNYLKQQKQRSSKTKRGRKKSDDDDIPF